MNLRPEPAARDPMVKIRWHLGNLVTLAEDVDGERGFRTPAPGQRLDGVESLPGNAAHPRKGLDGPEPGQARGARSCQPHHQAVTAAGRSLRWQYRYGHIRASLTHRGHQLRRLAGGVLKIGVEKYQVPGTGR